MFFIVFLLVYVCVVNGMSTVWRTSLHLQTHALTLGTPLALTSLVVERPVELLVLFSLRTQHPLKNLIGNVRHSLTCLSVSSTVTVGALVVTISVGTFLPFGLV